MSTTATTTTTPGTGIFTSIENWFSKAWAEIEALAASPVGLTIDNALATAGGVGAAYAIIETVNPSNKTQTASDILVIQGALTPLLTGTAAPTSAQVSSIFSALKSTESAVIQTLAGMVGTQLFTMLQTYDGTPWAQVMGAFLNGLQYGALAMGGSAPTAAAASAS